MDGVKELNKSTESTLKEENAASVLNCMEEITKNMNETADNNINSINNDSRLVKISLPVNPISIMQSNTQFLNKSRNFLNFITEKSTNIMEKALLPQSVRHNPNLRPLNSNLINDKASLFKSNSDNDLSGNSRKFCDPLNDLINSKHMDLHSSSNLGIKSQSTVPINITELKTESKSNIGKNILLDENNTITSENDMINSNNMSPENNLENLVTNVIPDRFDKKILSNLDEAVLETVDKTLLEHPVYISLLEDYTDLKDINLKLIEKIEYMEKEKSGEPFLMKIKDLEANVVKLTNELRSAVAYQEILKRDYEIANKERESMVMKYAVGEKQLIDAQRAKDFSERRVKELTKEQEQLQNKLKQIQGERTRICNILDTKCRDVSELQKEVEHLKEEVSMKDLKLKWTQNKLKIEMEQQKETQQKLDKALLRINEMKEECEQVRRETQETIRKFQQSEENKAVTLDQQLKEQQAQLILERHIIEDKEMLRLQLQKEVDILKQRQTVLIEENNTLSLKIQDSEKNRLNIENNYSNLKVIADQRQKEIAELQNKVSELEMLKLQLQHKEQCLLSSEVEVQNLRQCSEEMQSDMESCRQREAHMLDFTQKLTDKNVRLQSEFSAIEAKVKELESDQGPLRTKIHEMSVKIKTLEENLIMEKKKRIEECETLSHKLSEQALLAQSLSEKLEDSQGENAVLRRKQQTSLKEMTRELQQCRRKLEILETASSSNALANASRVNSNSSLNTDTANGALPENGDQIVLEPSRQSLIDRIIKLQKINVRRAEKLDFLEEHTRTLVEELQKKTKIIQNYILHENFDAMGSNDRDRHKAELARYGGIMASVYSHKVSDENMTLELSLEINQKLQSVLEDALLKNITLKDNIDTLGEEIARLTIQNQRKLTS
ncbi:coiled-coil domain-containing protein 186-like isoform X2 [Prorops nasuta]|uniref:coiled-coil domain-containing protein 186-like isoform X2 n=1 Tax=Prorops nasuta TaxID=863751 RepID=UPI0034CDCBAE